MLHREKRRGSPSGVADLEVNVLHMMLSGTPGDDQPLGDLLVRQAAGQQPQHLDLAVAEPGRPLPAYSWPLLPSRDDDSGYAVGVEPPGGCFAGEMLCGLFDGAGRPVGPVLGGGLEGVGGREDPR